MSKAFATYKKHHGDSPAGHIYLDKEGACTITLEGAASMSQDELDSYGEIMVEALNRCDGEIWPGVVVKEAPEQEDGMIDINGIRVKDSAALHHDD